MCGVSVAVPGWTIVLLGKFDFQTAKNPRITRPNLLCSSGLRVVMSMGMPLDGGAHVD